MLRRENLCCEETNYLHEHKGLAFLIEFYDVEHLQSMDETIDDLIVYCQKNGGTLAGTSHPTIR